MLTKPIASALYTKLCAASGPFLRSQQGKYLVAKAIKLVEKKEGKEEATVLENLLTVAAILD